MNQPCGCCAGIEVVTPLFEANRPGLSAIAYRVGTHATFLQSMLARLTSLGVRLRPEDVESWLLSAPDLIRPASLATKLKTPKVKTPPDPLSAYLRAKLSAATRNLLDQYEGPAPPSGELEAALVDDLNGLLQGPSLYDPPRFVDVALPDEVWSLVLEEPQGPALTRLNRRLLESAYPLELARSQVLYPLHGLTTRSRWDPSIALLDSWATVADVLTFYQERIATEGYLRTATERRSILELATARRLSTPPGGRCERLPRLHRRGRLHRRHPGRHARPESARPGRAAPVLRDLRPAGRAGRVEQPQALPDPAPGHYACERLRHRRRDPRHALLPGHHDESEDG